MANGVPEKDFIELKVNIENYIKTENNIKNNIKNMKNDKLNKNLLYDKIKESMVKNEINELQTDFGKIQLVKSMKKKPINIDIIKNAILAKIKNVNKIPSEYGYNKLIEHIMSEIEEERKLEEVYNLKFIKNKNKK